MSNNEDHYDDNLENEQDEQEQMQLPAWRVIDGPHEMIFFRDNYPIRKYFRRINGEFIEIPNPEFTEES